VLTKRGLQVRDQGFTRAVIRLFWHRAPRAVGRVSPALGWLLLSDRYLLAWPRLAAFAPTAGLALGMLTGLAHPGGVYSGSLLVIFLLIAVGAAGPASGLWFLVGFLPMDLLVRPGLRSEHISNLGLVVADLLLVLLLVPIAASTVRLRRQFVLWWLARRARGSRPPRAGGSPALEIVGGGLVYSMLTWAWLESVPAFIRPVYTWAGTTPDTSVVAPVQGNTLLLTLEAWVAAGAVAWIGLRAVGLAVTPITPERDPRELPAWAAVPLLAALGVLIAAGLLSGPWDALALFVVLVLGQLAQRRVGRSARWFGQIHRLPDAMRLLAVLVATAIIGLLVVAPLFEGGTGLWPVLLVTMLGLALTAVAMPQRKRSALEEESE
jgi:hypothetical protein